jgi:RHH-type proline utilization regulon transcriptional repressor/proline dehydrogenase/delta 1-pyrroline-5-carboxylate dehydrogenase
MSDVVAEPMGDPGPGGGAGPATSKRPGEPGHAPAGQERGPVPQNPGDGVLVAWAERTAAQLMVGAAGLERRADRRRRRRIGALVADEASREFLFDLTDQVIRIGTHRRAARRLHDLVAERGVPLFAGGLDRLGLLAGGRLARLAPGVVMPLVTARLRHEFSAVVLPAGRLRLARHVRRRRREHIALNVNLLGEAVLGEREALRRTERIAALLERPDVDYVSVKISSVCAQLDVLAYEDSLARIRERLRAVFLAAARADPPKFVNLDMEEYRDLGLTLDAFTTLLVEPDLARLDAGIVLQAYLPDSVAAMERLAAFARRRHAEHGSTVKVRIVKGANLAMERVEAELRGWPQAPFATKAEVDANYKRLLDLALAPHNAGALRVGAASHNLFDVGWALAWREVVGGDRLEIEMLEGMANPQARAVARLAGRLLLYAPIVRRHDFESAVAYLVRRFDENTAPENFLAQLFELEPGSPAWEAERSRFEQAVVERRRPAATPRRNQDRREEESRPAAAPAEPVVPAPAAPFRNEPDTDFALPANRAWLSSHLASWRDEVPAEVPAVVGGERIGAPLSGIAVDPSRPAAPLYRYVEADGATVERAVTLAQAASRAWAARPATERAAVLRAVAGRLAATRGRAIAVMAHDAAKTVSEGDPEVSEAIDFARYYAQQAERLERHAPGRRFVPHGVVLVASPWNFPLAIPAGGVLAALAAGSAVILKPAPETVLTAWYLAGCCWTAGVPEDVLQFVPTADDEVGRRLVTHEGVDAVVLTGAFGTARLFLGWRPDLALHAETSGKNALVVTSAADQDDAIRDLLRSAFSHAGQKCSAASLAIVEAALYDDAAFLARLADAVSSLRVGPACDPATQVGPLIRPPSGPLARALGRLEAGERWLVRPRQVGENPCLWSPGVKTGVAPGSEFHLTECFGPVLGLMRAADLDEAIALQNAPAYGLTGGIATLDDAEIGHWLGHVEVGNAYVNRHVTGAIVQRQPFGGWKRSVVGPGAKAGGPHYVASLGHWAADGGAPPVAAEEIERARVQWRRLSGGEDPTGLTAERNELRLRAHRCVALRFALPPDPVALEVALNIAAETGAAVECSADAAHDGLPASCLIESDDEFVARVASLCPDRVRLLGRRAARPEVRDRNGPPEPAGGGPLEPAPRNGGGVGWSGGLRLALLDAGLDVDVEPLSPFGEVELLRWTREQAVSETLHRHGNVRQRLGTAT